MKTSPAIYGIGNPIVDIIFHVSDNDIKTLGLQKGTVSLVTKKRQTEIINYLQTQQFQKQFKFQEIVKMKMKF